MKVILGKKIGMSRVFDSKGKAAVVTLIEAGPVFVTQIKSKDKDGYEAVQVGFGQKKNPSKALSGHLKKSELGAAPRWLKEFRFSQESKSIDVKPGAKIDVSLFQVGDKVAVSGTSKGKGFQGVMKRHGFAGGPASHGQKHSAREAGSIGATGPQRVLKGTRMAGRMGGTRITVKNLEIVRVIPEDNLIAVKGAVPGPKGQLLEIKTKL